MEERKPNKTLFYAIFTALIILAFVLGKRCEGKHMTVIPTNTDTLKTKAKELAVKSDSVSKEVKKADSVRVKVVIKWKEVRHDSLIPCEELIAYCDTLYYADSTLITELKAKVFIDSLLLNVQKGIISNDSIRIVGLNKEVKKQKRLRNLFIATTVLFGGAAAVK